MEIPRIDFNRKYRIISRAWDSSVIGKGTISRLLSKLLIPKPTGKVIAKNMHGFDLLLDPLIDNGVEKSLYYFGTYEKGTLDFINRNLTIGDTFFDIGANIGLMSIFASKCVGASGQVFAFEANPETAKILNTNIELNHLKNITVIDRAVGNSVGKIRIYNNWNVNRGGATLIKPQSGDTESFEIDLIRIDSEKQFENIPVNMVKIDVEGFELDVLKGMEHILKRNNPPKLIIECSADRNNNYDSVHAIFDFIKSVNTYKIFKLSNTKERYGELIEIKSKENLPAHDNIFCIKN